MKQWNVAVENVAYGSWDFVWTARKCEVSVSQQHFRFLVNVNVIVIPKCTLVMSLSGLFCALGSNQEIHSTVAVTTQIMLELSPRKVMTNSAPYKIAFFCRQQICNFRSRQKPLEIQTLPSFICILISLGTVKPHFLINFSLGATVSFVLILSVKFCECSPPRWRIQR